MNITANTLPTLSPAVRSHAPATTSEASTSGSLLDRVDLKGVGSREPDFVSRTLGGLYGAVTLSQLAMPIGGAIAGPEGLLLYAAAGAVAGGCLGYEAGFKTTGFACLGAVGGAVVGSMTGGLLGRTVGSVAGAALGVAASHIHLRHEQA